MSAQPDSNDGSKLIQFESSKSVSEVVEAIKKTAPEHKFGVLHVHNISEIFKKKGVEGYERETSVMEVCNPQHAKRVLQSDLRVASMLPCRIAVISDKREDGSSFTRVETVRPSLMMSFFPDSTDEVRDVACQVDKTMSDIMKAAV